MSRRKCSCFVVLCGLFVGIVSTNACSTFFMPNDGKPIFGRNYDWMVGEGYLLINKRNLVKVGMTEENPPTWTSKYGSITFNQFGRELPCGGMNEAGLVVEQMWLSATSYPLPDERPALNVLQWIQYQLDTCATVDEVLATDKSVRIQPGGGAPLHYLVADRDGRCATIEFIEGKTVVHMGDDLPARVLTNSTYDESLKYLLQHTQYGGEKNIQYTPTSMDRFVCAADMIRQYESSAESAIAGETNVVDYAFDILKQVAQGKETQWSIVYDLAGGRIHYRTQTSPQRRYIDFASCDFDCDTPARMINLDTPTSGDVFAAMTDYSTTHNQELIVSVFAQVEFLKGIPHEELVELAAYPESAVCRSQPSAP